MQRATYDEPEIEVRPPITGRLLQLGLAAVGAWAFLIVTTTLVAKWNAWALLAGVALLVWVGYYYRLLSVAVLVRGDTLTVRNLSRTRHIVRSAVAEVTLGESSLAKTPNQTVVIRTSSGQRLPLDACARSTQSRRKARRVEDFQRRLAIWSGIEQTASSPELTSA